MCSIFQAAVPCETMGEIGKVWAEASPTKISIQLGLHYLTYDTFESKGVCNNYIYINSNNSNYICITS